MRDNARSFYLDQRLFHVGEDRRNLLFFVEDFFDKLLWRHMLEVFLGIRVFDIEVCGEEIAFGVVLENIGGFDSPCAVIISI